MPAPGLKYTHQLLLLLMLTPHDAVHGVSQLKVHKKTCRSLLPAALRRKPAVETCSTPFAQILQRVKMQQHSSKTNMQSHPTVHVPDSQARCLD
jgi:hypothetical protein